MGRLRHYGDRVDPLVAASVDDRERGVSGTPARDDPHRMRGQSPGATGIRTTLFGVTGEVAHVQEVRVGVVERPADLTDLGRDVPFCAVGHGHAFSCTWGRAARGRDGLGPWAV